MVTLEKFYFLNVNTINEDLKKMSATVLFLRAVLIDFI
jgi:hypothetical protein